MTRVSDTGSHVDDSAPVCLRWQGNAFWETASTAVFIFDLAFRLVDLTINAGVP